MTSLRWPVLLLVAAASAAGACSPGQVRYVPVAPPEPDADGVLATLFLLGDAGEVNDDRAAVLAHLSDQVERVAAGGRGPQVVVAFLGDNVYEEGAPLEPTPEDSLKIAAQIEVVPALPNVQGVFLPGNHDWAKGAEREQARAAVLRQRQWIDGLARGARVRMLPDDGCPGPVLEEVDGTLALLFVDTEWLLRGAGAACDTPEAFYDRLAERLRELRSSRVVVLSHHPLVSGGAHGGNVAPLQRGPFVHWLVRKAGVGLQDMASPRYAAMIAAFGDAFRRSGAPPFVFASGHDHSLQVIRMGQRDGPGYQLVSGAGSKSEPARRIDGTRYATDHNGYMRLDFRARDARLTVYALPEPAGPPRAVFACTLTPEAPASECPEAQQAGVP